MNRRIRRLGIALVALFGLLFVQVVLHPGVRGRRGSRQRRERRAPDHRASTRWSAAQILTADGTVLALSTPTGANASLPLRAATTREGPLYAGITGLLLADLRPDRAGAGDEHLPVGRRAGARGLDARRPGPRPAEEGRARRHHDRRATCSRWRPTRSAPCPERSSRSIRAPATSSRWSRTPRSTRTSCRRRTRPTGAGGVGALERRSRARRCSRRANDELFPPGSTFKIVTASAALENGYGLDSTWPNPHELDLPLTNEHHPELRRRALPGRRDARRSSTAFTSSCNVIFGEIGLELGAQKLADQAHAFGFCPTDPPDADRVHRTDDPVRDPVRDRALPGRQRTSSGNEPLVAISAIGQDNDLAEPAADGARRVGDRERRRR